MSTLCLVERKSHRANRNVRYSKYYKIKYLFLVSRAIPTYITNTSFVSQCHLCINKHRIFLKILEKNSGTRFSQINLKKQVFPSVYKMGSKLDPFYHSLISIKSMMRSNCNVNWFIMIYTMSPSLGHTESKHNYLDDAGVWAILFLKIWIKLLVLSIKKRNKQKQTKIILQQQKNH